MTEGKPRMGPPNGSKVGTLGVGISLTVAIHLTGAIRSFSLSSPTSIGKRELNLHPLPLPDRKVN